MDNQNTEEINTLLQELHTVPATIKAAETFSLSGEDLKQFLLDQAGMLIKNSVECVNSYKDLLGGNPDIKEAEALAELIKAASTTIESLNKVYIQDERTKSAREVENIRAKAKQELANNESSLTIKMSRKDLMNMINNKTKSSENIIDVE